MRRFLAAILAALALPAAGAVVVRHPIVVDVAGQQVQFTAGQEVSVIGVNNGVAMLRVTLPNGTLAIAQVPVTALMQTAAPAPAQAPAPAATPYYRPVATPPPATPSPFPPLEDAGNNDNSNTDTTDLGGDALATTAGLATYTEAKARNTANMFGVYIPRSYSSATPMPLLVDAHGNGGNGVDEVKQWRNLADSIGFIAVCPTFLSSVVPTDANLKSDDKMLANVMKRVLGSFNVDRKHVLFTGFSGGGFATWYLATKDSKIFTSLCFRSANFDGALYNLTSSIARWRDRPVYMYLSAHDDPNINEQQPAALAFLKRSISPQYLKFEILQNDDGHKSHPEMAAKWFQAVIQSPDAGARD